MCETTRSNGCNRVTVEEVKTLAKLCSNSKNVEVVDFSLRPFSKNLGYLGVHELLTLDIDERDAKESTKKKLTFFVKSIAPSGNDFDHLAFNDESFFFNSVVPRLLEDTSGEPWTAKCYLANKSSMVLEDLMAKDFKVIDGPLDVSHIKAGAETLGRFHASSIILESKMGQMLNAVYPSLTMSKMFFKCDDLCWKWILAGMEVTEAIAHSLGLNVKYVRAAYDSMEEKMSVKEGRTNVFCHCDLWLNNMMFNKTDKINCRIIDFQMVCYLFYAVDLCQLIYLNLTSEVRKNIEREVLKAYHSALSETLRDHNIDKDRQISLEDVIEDFEEMKIVGLVTAAQFWPVALLNNDMIKEYSHDIDKMESYKYVSRKDFIFRVMQLDSDYRGRMEGIVRDLVEYMEVSYKGSI